MGVSREGAGAAERLVPQFAPQAFALRLDELEMN
jgi:hypothetical protein